jgi:hypothetical protein
MRYRGVNIGEPDEYDDGRAASEESSSGKLTSAG